MKKTVSILLVCMTICCLFAACKSNKSDSKLNEKLSIEKINAKIQTDPYNDFFAFNGDYAFGQLNDDENYSCYDKNGKVKFALPKEVQPLCVAKDGSLIAKGNNTIYLIDSNGKSKKVDEYGEGVNWALNIGDLATRPLIDLAIKEAAKDGYIVLARENSSFSGTKYDAAIIKNGKIIIDFNSKLYDFLDQATLLYEDSMFLFEIKKGVYNTLDVESNTYKTNVSKPTFNKSKTADLSDKYDTFSRSDEYVDGYAVVYFENDSNTFFSIADTNNKLLFEPIECSTGAYQFSISGKYILNTASVNDAGGKKLMLYLYDFSGKLVAEKEYKYESSVSNAKTIFSSQIISIAYYGENGYVIEHFNTSFDKIF